MTSLFVIDIIVLKEDGIHRENEAADMDNFQNDEDQRNNLKRKGIEGGLTVKSSNQYPFFCDHRIFFLTRITPFLSIIFDTNYSPRNIATLD